MRPAQIWVDFNLYGMYRVELQYDSFTIFYGACHNRELVSLFVELEIGVSLGRLKCDYNNRVILVRFNWAGKRRTAKGNTGELNFTIFATPSAIAARLSWWVLATVVVTREMMVWFTIWCNLKVKRCYCPWTSALRKFVKGVVISPDHCLRIES